MTDMNLVSRLLLQERMCNIDLDNKILNPGGHQPQFTEINDVWRTIQILGKFNHYMIFKYK